MKNLLFGAILVFSLVFSKNSFGQNQVQLSDIEIINLGDGQTYGQSRTEDKIAINGKTRIITGVTTEYIDAEFTKGLATGKWEYYKKNKLSVYVSYDNGYMNGEYEELFPSGATKIKGTYSKGKKEGEWQTLNNDGDLRESEIYKNNDLEKRINYYTNGNISKERNYKNGRENGAVKEYTLEGELKSEKNYVNGKQVGKQVQYYHSNLANFIETSNYSPEGRKEGVFTQVYVDGGKFKQKGQYSKNQKVGTWIFEDMSGKKIREEIYENGVLKSTTKFE